MFPAHVTNRRSSGVASLHTLLLAVEAVLLWIGIAAAVTSIRAIAFTTLLPLPAYPVAIAASLVFSVSAAVKMEANLVMPGWADAMRLAFRQIFGVACAVFTLVVGMKDPGISRLFLAVYLPTTCACFVFLNRFQPGWLVRLLYGRNARLPTLILGEAERFPGLDQWMAIRRKYGFEPVGAVAYKGAVPRIPGLVVAGEFEHLKAVIAATGAQQVLMLNLPANAEDSEHLAKVCAGCGCRLLIHNDVTFRLSYPLRVLMQDGYSFLAFQDEPLEDPLNRFFKRLLDIAIAVPITVLLLPPLALIVAAIQRVQSPGPLWYRQLRSGRAGRTFRIVKFRTMHVPRRAGPGHMATDERARVYPFGRFLRKTSLDELPQFLNVLAGDMSVVGPRPHHVRQENLLAGAVNEYRVRFFVKPGITGLAQSRGLRGEMQTPESIQQRLQLDLLYIHSWSVWLDLAIIGRTMRQVVIPPQTAR